MISVKTLVKTLHRTPKTPRDLIVDINSCAGNEQERTVAQYPEMADSEWQAEVFRLAKAEGWSDYGFSGWAGLGFTQQPCHWQDFRVAKTGRHRWSSVVHNPRKEAEAKSSRFEQAWCQLD